MRRIVARPKSSELLANATPVGRYISALAPDTACELMWTFTVEVCYEETAIFALLAVVVLGGDGGECGCGAPDGEYLDRPNLRLNLAGQTHGRKDEL